MSDESLLRRRSGFSTRPETESKWPADPAERGRAMAAAGVIGGARYGRLGGMPMHKDYQERQAAHERVAQTARENSEELARMLMRIIRSEKSAFKDKIDAYRELMAAEQFVAKNTLAHERELRKMSDDEQLAYLQRKTLEVLGYDPDRHDLNSLDDVNANVIEGTAVDDGL